jgi:formiminoglutamase
MNWDKGRFDGDSTIDQRFWQIVQDFNNIDKSSKEQKVCFVGFPSDDGVKQNLGRVGSAMAPDVIRNKMLSIPKVENVELYDVGNIPKKNQSLNDHQLSYANKISDIISKNCLPIGLGGGHEIAYGTFCGVKNAQKKDTKIGIINFDAHLDMRPYDKGTSSGTMFKQIADENKEFHYLPIGIQTIGNTQRLFSIAKQHSIPIITFEDTINKPLIELQKSILNFIDKVDVVYLTFCMDVFDISDAPGVSAPSAIGIDKRLVLQLLQTIFSTKKIVAVDFAEVNPSLDIDERTSRLVAYLIHYLISLYKI